MANEVKQMQSQFFKEFKFTLVNFDNFLKYVQHEVILSVGGITADKERADIRDADAYVKSRVYTGLLPNNEEEIIKCKNLEHGVNSYLEGSVIQKKLNGLVESIYSIGQSLDSKREMMAGQRIEISARDNLEWEFRSDFVLEYILTIEKKVDEPLIFISISAMGRTNKYEQLIGKLYETAHESSKNDKI